MTHHGPHFKRHQHSTAPFGHRSALPAEEDLRETIQNFSRLLSRPFPNHAKRGGRTGSDRRWRPSTSLPKRAIHYDLAESFMDHSTNPLSSDLYKVRFRHSTKPWPDGRFRNYKEKLYQDDGGPVDVLCQRIIPTIPKRRKVCEPSENEQTATDAVSTFDPMDPVLQEQRKKLADQQTNIYASFYGTGRQPQFPTASQMNRKTAADPLPTVPPVVGRNQED